MAEQLAPLFAFNRGRVSPLALARTDLQRVGLSAETMTNWMPRVMGSMMLRPGLGYLGATASNNTAFFIPFVFKIGDTALVEITDAKVRVWYSGPDVSLITRATVTAAVTNGSFTGNITSWTDASESGGTAAWSLIPGSDETGSAALTGNGSNAGIIQQQITVNETNTEHALTIVIAQGPVVLKIGSSAGNDDYITETSLGTGTHSIAFTPTGDFYIEFSNRLTITKYVQSCTVESAGVMSITAPWAEADLSKIRYDQSGDIIFVACDGYQQYKIERRTTTSWSVVKYVTDDGPFRDDNVTGITITPSAVTGNITLTASYSLFRSTLVGSLFRLTHSGQDVTKSVSAENQFTDSITVTGTSRAFSIIRSGSWTATVTLQRSFTDPDSGPWEDITTYTTNDTISYDDGLDNQEIFYRIGVATGDFVSGPVVLELKYNIGSTDGIVRILAYTSTVSVDAEVLSGLGSTDATDTWAEGDWSSYRGFPTSVAFVEGRLGWFGRDKAWISVSDQFYSFDENTLGDSGPINRQIATGPVDTIEFALALQRLILGGQGDMFSCKSSALDTPYTPTDFAIRSAGPGAGPVGAIRVDKKGLYVHVGGTRLMEIAFDGNDLDYGATDMTIIIPEAGEPSIVRIQAQRLPDTRIHCVRSDGTVGVMIYDRAEKVVCWVDVETDGTVEDVVVLPADSATKEDYVYYVVNRTINGSTVRYLERWAFESQCQGGTTNRQADSYITFTSGATLSGLDHLEGETVVCWGDGVNLGSYTVTSGAITPSTQISSGACVGLSYTAQFKSTKLAYSQTMTLTQKRKVSQLGVILYNTHYQGLQYGPDFTTLRSLSLKKSGATVSADTVHSTWDQEAFAFPGTWDSDSRICLQATAPKPCTILAAIVGFETHAKN